MTISTKTIVIGTLFATLVYSIVFTIIHDTSIWTIFLANFFNDLFIIILIGLATFSFKEKYWPILIGSILIIIIITPFALDNVSLPILTKITNTIIFPYVAILTILVGLSCITYGVYKIINQLIKNARISTLLDQTSRAIHFEYDYNEEMVYLKCTDSFIERYQTLQKSYSLPLDEFLSYVHSEDLDEMSKFIDRQYEHISIERYYRLKLPNMVDYICLHSKSLPTLGNVFASVEIDFSETQDLINIMSEKDKLIKYNKQDLDFIINHSNDFIVKYDREGKLNYASESFLSFFDVKEKDIKGKTYEELDTLFQIGDDNWFHSAMNEEMTSDFVKSTYKGKTYWISWENHTVTDKKGKFDFLISIGTNLTEMMMLNERLDFDRNHDPLTKLYNRRGLYSIVSKLNYKKYTLFFIDIHHFMTVNEYYGSEVGDDLIIQIAETLKNIDTSILVARYEGDEFILITNNDTDLDDVIGKLRNIQKNIYQHKQISVPIHLHIGYAKNSGNDSLAYMITNAALAMAQSRRETTLQLVEYTPGMRAQLKEKIAIIEKLKSAITNDLLEVHFQAIVDVNSNKIILESLARWYDKDIGYISPDAFFQVAKEASLIFDLDYHLIKKSIRTFKKILSTTEDKSLICSINFTMETLFQDGIIGRISNYAKKQGLSPSQFCIEISESTFVKNENHLLQQIKIMKKLGFLVAIDDFGKEYSSLSIIKSLNVDYIKIDKVFVEDLGNKNNLAIINMVVEISKLQKSRVIVEGVELQEQFIHLRSLGCNYFQGFYIERPHDYIKKIKKG